MATPELFGEWTPAERRAALVHLAGLIYVHRPPKTFPPNKDGEAKEVKPGQGAFASAVWAKRLLENCEFAAKPKAATAGKQGADGY